MMRIRSPKSFLQALFALIMAVVPAAADPTPCADRYVINEFSFGEFGTSTITDIDVTSDLIVIATYSGGTFILDRNSELDREILAIIPDRGGPVAIRDNVLISEANPNSYFSGNLAVFDISDPTNPIELASLNTNTPAQNLVFADDILYTANGGAGVHAIDFSDPALPVRLATIPLQTLNVTGKYASDLDILGNFLYIAEGYSLRVFDISDPAAPIHLRTEAVTSGSCCVYNQAL